MDNLKYCLKKDPVLLARITFEWKMKEIGITDKQELFDRACFLMSEAQQDAEQYKKQARRWKAIAISAILIGVLAISIIAGVWYASENGTLSLPVISPTAKDTSAATSPPVASKPVTDSQLPRFAYKNGQIIKSPYTSNRPCPLEIVVTGDFGYYVYLDCIGDESKDMSFMVTPDSTAEVDVPLGTYEIYYACGYTWYGTTHKFGSKTVYNKCDGTFRFYEDGEYYQGYTLELYLQSNGNLDTDEIPESQFPG